MEKGTDIEKLSGSKNYHTWSFAMRNVLALKGFEKCIVSGTGTETDAGKLRSSKAILSLGVQTSIYGHIQNCNSALEIWKTLKGLYEDNGLSRKIGLLRNLISTRLENSSSMQQYIDEIVGNANRLKGIGFDLTDEWLAAILLAGLSENYRPLIMGIEAANAGLKSDTIISKLLDTPSSDDKGAATAFFNNQKSKSTGFDKKKKKKCFHCKKAGHTADVCRKRKSDEDGKTGSTNSTSSHTPKVSFIAVTMNSEKPIALNNSIEMRNAFAAPTSTIQCNEWYVDSGASSHMTPYAEYLTNMKPTNAGKVMGANSAQLDVKGIGNATLKLPSSKINVEGVLHVPELSANLLSVHHIVNKNGNSVLFDMDGCTIKNGAGETVAQCKATNGVYKFISHEPYTLLAKQKPSAVLWHRRLGHINLQRMKQMRDKAVTGLDFDDSEDGIRNCTVCAMGKQTRLPFGRSENRSTHVLDLIHSDIIGPMETQSIGAAKYVLTFIDDYSRKLFVYFLRNKSETMQRFVEFKARVENQTERKIKILRTDNGTEYGSKEFKKLCKQAGIQHQLTNTYTPQQNGTAERMNRSIIEKAKCMIFDADLPKCYWAEATHMAVYILNRSISAAHGEIPEELFTGKRVDLSNIKLFGSPVMVHVPAEKRKKWDRKSERMIFVGFDDDTKGYRCINRNNGKLTISRDVIFHEIMQMESINVTDDNDSVRDTEVKNDESIIDVDSSDEQTDDYTDASDAANTSASANEIMNENMSDTSIDGGDPNDRTYQQPNGVEANNIPEQRMITRRQAAQSTGNARPFQLTNFAFFVEPSTVAEAIGGPNASDWSNAMSEELKSHQQNNTWTLENLPAGRKAIKSKWVFKAKTDDAGKIIRYKARLVAKGCSQKPGIDYSETFSPVVRYNSIRFLLALAAKNDLKIHQMDVITAFLQGDLNEEIFMEQPEKFNDGTNRVCRLRRSIYGLKQAGRQWNLKLDEALRKFGLRKSQLDPCVYYTDDLQILIAIYVDDFLLFFKDMNKLQEVKQYLCSTFRMKDMGAVSSCIGMRIRQFNDAIEIDQSIYVKQILDRFGMADSKPVKTPSETGNKLSIQTITPENSLVGQIPYQEAVGSLLYLTQLTRPDIAFAVNDVSRFNANHESTHWMAVKRIFRYLKGTSNARLRYTRTGKGIVAFSDADWASEIDKRRSCSGFVINMSGAAICWSSKRQPIVAMSSTEAEYIALSTTASELVWLKQFADELKLKIANNVTIFCDNQSTIKLTASDAYRPRTKHIDIRFHRIRELVDDNVIKIKFVSTNENAADSLTKAVPAEKTEFCNAAMGLQSK